MNIFKSEIHFIGEAPLEHLRQSTEEFWQQAISIRKQLEKRGYLLDKYLSMLFEAANEKIATEASDSGFNKLSEQYGLFKKLIEGETDNQEHPLYQRAKAHLDSNPLPYQETYTRISMYLASLEHDLLSMAVNKYLKEAVDTLEHVIDIPNFRELYRDICDLLGSEGEMEKLNALFQQRFIRVTSTMSFIQAFTNDLMYILTYRDNETSRLIFQLLLDDMAEEEQ